MNGPGHTIYHQPFTAVNDNFYRVIEDGVTKWWNKAEELAGDRLEYVQRSRLHWRYMQLMLHPDATKAAALIAEVEGLGMAWKEGRYHVNIEESNLNQGPGRWSYY